jgi:hypothetical protein
VRAETRGKSITEVCAITEKGLAYLVAQTSPKQAIEDFLRALDARQEQLGSVLDSVRQMQRSLEAIRALAERLAPNATLSVGPLPSANGAGSWQSEIASHLSRWHETGANSDCPLPDLYRHVVKSAPHLTIGQFHDCLQKLHDEAHIYLHPWTGPLCDLPEPSLALLIGHEIAYYASIRNRGH